MTQITESHKNCEENIYHFAVIIVPVDSLAPLGAMSFSGAVIKS